jgi:hypothetical protein
MARGWDFSHEWRVRSAPLSVVENAVRRDIRRRLASNLNCTGRGGNTLAETGDRGAQLRQLLAPGRRRNRQRRLSPGFEASRLVEAASRPRRGWRRG